MPTIEDLIPESEREFSYLIDLTDAAELSEDNTGWLHAFSFGTYMHPVYGKITFDEATAKRMASNVNDRVRGIDIAIDYGHRASEDAAGWVRQAEVRDNGLWLLVEWTQTAAKKIREKAYRYFSPTFVKSWKHPESLKVFRDVLFGGGLTNRPFLKNMLPVNLSEYIEETPVSLGDNESEAEAQGGEQVDEFLKKLRETLQLSEDADENAVLTALTEALETKPSKEEEESTPNIKQLAEEHPEVKQLMERVAGLETAHRLTEASYQIDNWNRSGMPVALNESAKVILLNAGEKVGKAFSEFVSTFIDKGVVKQKEVGSGHSSEESDVDLSEIDKGIKALMDEDDALTYPMAAERYFAENEEAFAAYARASYDPEMGGE